MNALDVLTAIGGAKSLAMLETYSRALWEDWGASRLTDDEAQTIAEAIAARRRDMRAFKTFDTQAKTAAPKSCARASCFPAKRKRPPARNNQASIERRRRLATSGPMPPTLACHFTTGELAVLHIVADEVRDRGACRLTLGEIAGRAGVGVTTARNAIQYAARDGLVTIEERRRNRQPNLANIVKIVSQEWIVWIKRGERSNRRPPSGKTGGSKKMESTDRASYITITPVKLSGEMRTGRELALPENPRSCLLPSVRGRC